MFPTEEEQAVQVTRVDERDNGWEDSHPRFRVYLHGSGEKSTDGWTDTYDITGADVLQVIDWAQRRAGQELTYAVALVHTDNNRERPNAGFFPGLVWLIGMDGNGSTEGNPDGLAVQQRIFARRRSPVGIPDADRASSE